MSTYNGFAALDLLLKEYFEKNGKLTALKMAEIAKRGRLPGCAPVGYKNAFDERGERTIEIDPIMAPLVIEAFQLVAEGGMSLREILDRLTEKGLRSRSGRVIKGSNLWPILENPFYAGKLRYHYTILPGTHPTLINEELFSKVQNQLRSRGRNRK